MITTEKFIKFLKVFGHIFTSVEVSQDVLGNFQVDNIVWKFDEGDVTEAVRQFNEDKDTDWFETWLDKNVTSDSPESEDIIKRVAILEQQVREILAVLAGL